MVGLIPDLKENPPAIDVDVPGIVLYDFSIYTLGWKGTFMKTRYGWILSQLWLTAEANTEMPLQDLIQMAPEGNAAEADLEEVVEYLLRSKHLAMPMEWLEVFQ